MTIGSFTVSDADAVDGSGCTEIHLTNNSTSIEAYRAFVNGDDFAAIDPGSFRNVATNDAEDYYPFDAFLADGSSMISGHVVNSGGNDGGHAIATPQPSGNIPCINVGGVAGK